MRRDSISKTGNVSIAVRIAADLHRDILQYLDDFNASNKDLEVTEAQVMRALLRKGLTVAQSELKKSTTKLRAVDDR